MRSLSKKTVVRPLSFQWHRRPNQTESELSRLTKEVDSSQAWIDLTDGLFYTSLRQRAVDKQLRLLTVPGLHDELISRSIGAVAPEQLDRFGEAIVELFPQGASVRVQDNNGSDFNFRVGKPPMLSAVWFMPGQANLLFEDDSANGKFVADGVVYPPEDVGVLESPLSLTYRHGRLVGFEGKDADRVRAWYEGKAQPDRWLAFHFSFGFNPGITQLSGVIAEDERVYGATVLGTGRHRDGIHSDVVSLSSVVNVNGTQVLRDRQFVHPTLDKLATWRS